MVAGPLRIQIGHAAEVGEPRLDAASIIAPPGNLSAAGNLVTKQGKFVVKLIRIGQASRHACAARQQARRPDAHRGIAQFLQGPVDDLARAPP